MHAIPTLRRNQHGTWRQFARMPGEHPQACFERVLRGRVCEGEFTQHGDGTSEMHFRRVHAVGETAGQDAEGCRVTAVGALLQGTRG